MQQLASTNFQFLKLTYSLGVFITRFSSRIDRQMHRKTHINSKYLVIFLGQRRNLVIQLMSYEEQKKTPARGEA
jgi:hypothetical protein